MYIYTHTHTHICIHSYKHIYIYDNVSPAFLSAYRLPLAKGCPLPVRVKREGEKALCLSWVLKVVVLLALGLVMPLDLAAEEAVTAMVEGGCGCTGNCIF